MTTRDDPKWEPGTCDNCAWFNPHETLDNGTTLGTCRVKSPVPVEEWPETLGTEWCGEWAYAGDKLRRGPGRYAGSIEKPQQAKDPGPMVTFKFEDLGLGKREEQVASYNDPRDPPPWYGCRALWVEEDMPLLRTRRSRRRIRCQECGKPFMLIGHGETVALWTPTCECWWCGIERYGEDRSEEEDEGG